MPEDSEASEEVASCERVVTTVDAKDEAATSAEARSACPGEIKATEQKKIGVHAVAGRRSAHHAATCVRPGQESWTLIHRAVC